MSARSGLAYDAEGVSLIGSFSDELAAYRARKTWIDVFTNFFLLERDRDYEMTICFCDESENFMLDCTFSSACGRYAFWRLINHQAPEAEEELCGTVESQRQFEQKNFFSSLLTAQEEPDPSWVIRSEEVKGAEDSSLRDLLLGRLGRFFS